MKPTLFALLLSCSLFSFAQEPNSVRDTANYPFWVDMMEDPEANFFTTQRAFNLYWDGREIEKGSGYKVFKRWEFAKSEIIDQYGNIPQPGVLEKRVEDYIQANAPPGFGGSGGFTINGTGPATCLTSGKWIDIGPDKLSGNRTSQPNGLGRINGLAFHPTDSLRIYIGAPAGGMWWTEDGGQTWQSNTDTLATLGVSTIAIDPVNPDTIYLGTGDRDAGDAYGRGVIRSFDGGQTWQVSNSGMGNQTVGRLIINPNDPSILLAATNGGIYRSTNYGSNWSRVQTGNFRDIVFDAVNPSFVYAARYNSGQFYRSTDNGQSWSLISSGIPTNKRRMAIAVTPDDSNYVYAIVTNTRTFEGLYLSTDRGLNFTRMSNTPNIMDYSHLGSGSSGQAWYDLDIAADPADRDVIYVGGVNIFKSTDKGKTWKINAHWVGSGGAPAIHADQHVLEYQPGTNTLFVGNDGGIYHTRNGGSSWTDISTGIGIAQIYRLSQGASARDHVLNGYQDNGTGMMESGSWYTVLGGDGMDCEIDPADPKYGYSDLYYGDVRRYTNGSYSGKIAANGTNGINESGGWVTPFILQEGTPSTMFIGYKNVWRSTNIRNASAGSVSWTKVSNNLAGKNNQNILHLENAPADPARLFMSRVDNKLFRTDNANAGSPTWTDLTSSLPNNADVLWIEAHYTNKDVLWICQSNKIYRSDNAGSSWTNISSGLPNIPVLCVVHDSSSKKEGLYLGTYMGVFYRDSSMSSWIWYNTGMPINTRVRDVEIYYDPSGRDKSHVIAGTYGRGNWRSPLYDEEQLPPVAEFAAEQRKVCANEVVKLEDLSLRNPTRWTWTISPATVTYLNGTDSCSQFPEVKFNAKGMYTVKLLAENCSGEDSITKVDLIEVLGAITPASCASQTTNLGNYGIGIQKVKIDSFEKITGSSYADVGYLDMACTDIITLKTDTGYFTQITTGTSYNENVKIYIDFNNNGDLSDTGELVFSTPKQKPLHEDTIHIPQRPEIYQLLRMRVMSDYDTIPDDPCDTIKYGQVEDYGVIFIPRIPIPGFYTLQDSVCQFDPVTVFDTSFGEISSYRWVISNGSWSDSSFTSGDQNWTLPQPGFYSLTLDLKNGQVVKTVDSFVYVSSIPSLTLDVPVGDTSGCEERTLQLRAMDNANVGRSYVWWKDGVIRSTDNSNTDRSILSLNPVSLSDSGSYAVVTSNNGCSDTSNNIKVTVHPKPTANFSTDPMSEYCEAENSVAFINSSTVSSGTLTHSWDMGGDGTSSSMSPTHMFSDTGSYSVRLIVTSDRNCADTAEDIVSILESPNAAFTSNYDSTCLKGNSFTFSDASTFNGTLNLSWDLGDGNSSMAISPSHEYLNPGLYSVRLIAEGLNSCRDTITRQVRVYPQIDQMFDHTNQAVNSSLCLSLNEHDLVGTSTILTGSIANSEIYPGDGSSYSGNVLSGYSYSVAGTYTPVLIEVSDQGCRDTITLAAITIDPDPTADFTLNGDIQCLVGNSFELTDNSSISSGTLSDFNWDLGDGNTTTGANPTAHSYGATGTYTIQLIVSSNRGCRDTTTRTVDVRPSPSIDFSATGVCLGDSTQFTNLSSIPTGSITALNWNFGDGSSGSGSAPTHVYVSPGSYDVKLIATSDQGCSDSLVKMGEAVVFALPTAEFTWSKTRSWERETDIQFSNASSADVVQWNWSLGIAGAAMESDPLVTFADTGTMNIRLKVSNSDGCEDTVSRTIFVFPESEMYVPGSFSPNKDALNEDFGVTGIAFVAEYHMIILNRWGGVLFESKDINDTWDGTYDGELVPSGTYIYYIEILDLNNEKHALKGTVNVFY